MRDFTQYTDIRVLVAQSQGILSPALRSNLTKARKTKKSEKIGFLFGTGL